MAMAIVFYASLQYIIPISNIGDKPVLVRITAPSLNTPLTLLETVFVCIFWV